MSKQLGSVLMFVASLAAIVIAANRAPEPTNPLGRSRGPASLAGDAPAPIRHTEKLHGPVDVTIELIGLPPSTTGDLFVLRGIITSSQRLEDVEYHWNVPAAVEVVTGQLRGVIKTVDAQRAVAVEVSLRARDGNNAQVHLVASARSRGVRFAETAQYNTTKQREFTDSRARLMKSTAAREDETAEGIKVYH